MKGRGASREGGDEFWVSFARRDVANMMLLLGRGAGGVVHVGVGVKAFGGGVFEYRPQYGFMQERTFMSTDWMMNELNYFGYYPRDRNLKPL